METTMVMANCRYRIPVSPLKNAAGRKTAIITRVEAIIGPVTSCIALKVAFFGGSPSLMFLSTFSRTMMASSTTVPIANTIPNKVIVLMEKPRAFIPANVPIIETGTARQGIIVAVQLCRKIRITKKTKMVASIIVLTTS